MRHTSQATAVVAIALILACSVALCPLAEAKKGKKGADPEAEAKMTKALEEIGKPLNEMLAKIQSRYLFSPKDSEKFETLRFQLMELMQQFPKEEKLIVPVYQAGVLSLKREQYDDAYALFQFLVSGHPESPYATRAGSEITAMKRKLGDTYFPEPAMAPTQVEDNKKSPAKKK